MTPTLSFIRGSLGTTRSQACSGRGHGPWALEVAESSRGLLSEKVGVGGSGGRKARASTQDSVPGGWATSPWEQSPPPLTLGLTFTGFGSIKTNQRFLHKRWRIGCNWIKMLLEMCLFDQRHNLGSVPSAPSVGVARLAKQIIESRGA